MAKREWLAKLLRVHGMTYAALADQTGVHPKTPGRWVRGEQNIYSRHRPAMAAAFAVSLEELDRMETAYQKADSTGSPPVAAPGELRSELWHTSAGAENLAQIVDELETVALTSTGDTRDRFLRLLGYTHQALGESAFDQLRFLAAVGHFQQMQELGFETDDPDLVSLAFIHQADIARRRRRYETATRLFAVSEPHARAAHPHTQARRWQTMARAHAERGETAQFLAAIDHAEQCTTEPADDPAKNIAVNPVSISHERAHGLTLLGSPTEALAIYEQSTPAFSSGRDRTNFTIIKAQALAHAGHLSEGVSLALTGLAEARAFGSVRFVSRVQRFYDRLLITHPARDRHLVELHDALAA